MTDKTDLKVMIGATLIDGNGGKPVPDAVVLINGTKIDQVGIRDHVDILDDAEVIDVTGKTIMPGMFDCHAHLAAHARPTSRTYPTPTP